MYQSEEDFFSMNAFMIDYGEVCGGQVEWEKGVKIGQDRTGQDGQDRSRQAKIEQSRPSQAKRKPAILNLRAGQIPATRNFGAHCSQLLALQRARMPKVGAESLALALRMVSSAMMRRHFRCCRRPRL